MLSNSVWCYIIYVLNKCDSYTVKREMCVYLSNCKCYIIYVLYKGTYLITMNITEGLYILNGVNYEQMFMQNQSGAIERRTTLAFPALRLIICILNTQMTSPSASGGHLNCFAWTATITLVLTTWWPWPYFAYPSFIFICFFHFLWLHIILQQKLRTNRYNILISMLMLMLIIINTSTTHPTPNYSHNNVRSTTYLFWPYSVYWCCSLFWAWWSIDNTWVKE